MPSMSLPERLAAISDIINNKRHRGGASSTSAPVGVSIDDDENDENLCVSLRGMNNTNHNVIKRRRIIAETMSPLRLMFVVHRTAAAADVDTNDNEETTTATATTDRCSATESAVPTPDALSLVPMDPLDTKTITATSKPAKDVLEIPSTGGVAAPLPKTLVADNITQDFVQYLKEQSKLVEESNQKLTEQRTEIFQSQTRIWNTYLEGLSTISQLTDLRHAPDAIMPHNF